MKGRLLAVVNIVVIFLLTLSSCNNEKYMFTEGYELHTPYHITYRSNRPMDKEIREILQKYYKSINAFDSTSIISRINRNMDVEPDGIFIAMFNKAMEIGKDTEGLMDVTCGPLVNLWGFGERTGTEINEESIKKALELTGYSKVRLVGNRIVKDNSGIQLNFAALGDGYSCDLVAEVMEKHGIQDYCIEIGGEIVTSGKNPKGNPWRVGIIEPVYGNYAENQTINRIVELAGKKGLATSGDYRNFRQFKGRTIGHIVNPVSGYPADTDVVSATVIAKDGVTADGYATAFMAMGSQKVQEFMDGRDDMQYFLICKSSDTTTFIIKSPDF